MRKVVCAFAFAVNPNALSNACIRRRAREIARNYGTPVLTQPELLGWSNKAFEVLFLSSKHYPAPTLLLARAVVLLAHARGGDEIVVVAAPPHQRRYARDFKIVAEELGIDLSIQFDQELDGLPMKTWFCRDSGNLHTRYSVYWIVREYILRILPDWVYKRVVS